MKQLAAMAVMLSAAGGLAACGSSHIQHTPVTHVTHHVIVQQPTHVTHHVVVHKSKSKH